ncbi:MAG TPA: glycosyltransferase family 4 protein [Acidimicrobiales bacterium]|nr:glycosyltransferase family 4 protein [Acidimicrobiales bacterium]
MAKGRVAFVPTRYGEGVIGGSEAVLREAAHGFAGRGWEVDVLTTTARSHFSWESEFDAGCENDGGLRVHRFDALHDGPRAERDAIERRIQLGLPVDRDEQDTWLHGNVRVPGLFHHLVEHRHDYDAVVLSPYLFWTTAVGWCVAPERTVVMPCLHDEHYAYLDVFRPVLTEVAQLWFLAEPEHELAHRLVGAHDLSPHRTTGAGIVVPSRYDAAGFRSRHGLGDRPFVLYAGRREHGKGWPHLLGAFAKAVLEHGADLDLVTPGVGPVDAPAPIAHRVHDLGFLSPDELADAFAAANAYVQPSTNESFSRTVMEAWLAGTGVIANGGSDVVAWHCRRSGAGVVYSEPEELVQALVLVARDPDLLRPLAGAGRQYVLDEYGMDVVLDRMEAGLEELAR